MYLWVFKKFQYCSVKALPSYSNAKIGNARTIRHHIQIAKVCAPWELTEFDKVQYNIQLCRNKPSKNILPLIMMMMGLGGKENISPACCLWSPTWSMFFNLYKHLKMMLFGNFAMAIKKILIHKLIPALTFIVTYFFCRGKKQNYFLSLTNVKLYFAIQVLRNSFFFSLYLL